jgi:anti-sigma factor RsiW
MTCDEAQALRDAYVDGELGLERSLEFERHLESCQRCAGTVASRRALGAALRERLEYHAAPPALHRALRLAVTSGGGGPGRRAPAPWMRLAASLVLVAALSSALTYYATPRSGDAIPDEVFASHVRAVQSGDRLIDVASSDRHTVKPWLDARLDFSAPVRDLATDGFLLLGGRVDYIGGHPAAALVYQYGKHVITLFVWPSQSRATPITKTTRRGDSLAAWSDGTMTYWAVSDIARPDLDAFCRRFEAAAATADAPEAGASGQR